MPLIYLPFRFLNNLKLIKLAVSLGSTESLIQHPYTMTHAGMQSEDKIQLGITPNLVRLSVGIENADDLISDIEMALQMVKRGLNLHMKSHLNHN